MAVEKVVAQIVAEVDDASLKKATGDVKTYARDTKKELDKSFLFKLILDKAQTKMELDNARALLKQAKKQGDEALTLKYTIKTQELQSKLTEAGRVLNNFKNTGEASVSRLGALFDSLSVSVGGLLTKLGGFAVGVGLVEAGKQTIFLGDKLEQATISFKTMLGSAEEAKLLLSDLAVFAKETPFELVGIRDTAKELLAVGIETENIIPTMKALGDVASMLGGPDVFGRLTYAFGQVKSAGRLTGNELRQFTETGVPLLAELGKNLGKTTAEIKDMVSNGEIGFSDVQKAFKSMTEEGGKFANGQSVQMDTLTGKWGKFKDDVNSTLESIGTSLLPLAKTMVDVFSFMLDFGKKTTTALQMFFAYSFAGISNGIIRLGIVFHAWGNGLKSIFIGITGYFQDLGGNISVFANNVGYYFNNIPVYIGRAMNAGLKKIEDFINKAGTGLNNLAKKLGYEGDLVGKISIGQINVGGTKGTIQQYKNTYREIAKIKQEELSQDMASYMQTAQRKIDINNNAYENFAQNLLKTKDVQKKLDTELKISDDNLTNSKDKNAKKLKRARDKARKEAEKQRKAEEKAREEADRKEVQRMERYEKYLETKRKEREAKIEKGKELITSYYENVRSEADKSKEKIEGFTKSIQESNQKIQELQSSLLEEKLDAGIKLAERKLDIETKLYEMKQKNADIEYLATTLSKDVLKGIGEGIFTEDLTGNTILEYKKLYEELAVIKQNANLISEQAGKQAEESESERIIRETLAKQNQIQTDIANENARLEILKSNKEQEQSLYDGINQYRTNLEKNFTSLMQLENQKRINSLEAVRIKAIETANALAKAGITNNIANTNNVNVNLQGTGYVSTDAYNIGEALTKNINLSTKGINR